MTAERGVIYRAEEALCGRKSILQHRVNPRHSGPGGGQSGRSRTAWTSCACPEEETLKAVRAVCNVIVHIDTV